MEYRRLGGSGLQLSLLSYGTGSFSGTFGPKIDTDDAAVLLKTAYDAGINFFDSAEAYGMGRSEMITGAALKKLGLPRETYCVSSKVMVSAMAPNAAPTASGLSRKHVFDACHAALGRFQLDYIDLFFCHRPDPEVPIEETLRAMHDLIQQGKIMYWGTSEWSAQELMEAYGLARQYHLTPPTMDQPQYNMFVRDRIEKEYQRLYSEIGLGTTVWSPLAGGLLSGKYNDGIPADSRLGRPSNTATHGALLEGEPGKRRLEVAKFVAETADSLGISAPSLALAWCMKNPHVSTVMMGARLPEQMKENLKAVDALSTVSDALYAEINARLDDINIGL